jgi:hypothetical protein
LPFVIDLGHKRIIAPRPLAWERGPMPGLATRARFSCFRESVPLQEIVRALSRRIGIAAFGFGDGFVRLRSPRQGDAAIGGSAMRGP